MARMVLVADDSPTIQKKAVGILKGEGFEIETVSNGVAAIKRLAVIHPVVVLADVSMPGRDGYEVCEFVKKSAEHSHVPVLLVASDMEPYDEARGTHVRADGIIKKPFDPQELISLVVKFADLCEAAAPAAPKPVVAPPAAPAPAEEFAISNEIPEETPAVMQPAASDFSGASEGVAFAEEETPASSPEPQPAEMAASYAAPQAEAEIAVEPAAAPEVVETLPAPEPQSAPVEEPALVVEEPPPASPPPSSPARVPSYLEGLEAATPEPVFIEEQQAPAGEPPGSTEEMRTMIFRAPLHIAEPVWKDETVPAPPAPEPAGATAVEPQLEAEAPVASPEIPVEQPQKPLHVAPSVTATSLDSFSLDDATAGQVHFATEAVEVAPEEVAQSVPAEEAPPTEIAPPEPAPEAVYTEMASPEAAPEAVYTEIASPEAAPEAVYTEMASPEAAPDAAPPEPSTEVAAPPPAYDWGLIYTVVHKVVVKMSPPALPLEAVEEMATRLANEIATEISSESYPPQA